MRFGVITGRTAQEILEIIEGAQFSISEPDDLTASSRSATNALRAGLKSTQPSLSEGDLKAISFFGTLYVSNFADITALINIGGDSKQCKLLVFTQNVKVDDVLKKITNIEVHVGYQKALNASDPTTSQAIKTDLAAKNPSLTQRDLDRITIEPGKLNPGDYAYIRISVTVTSLQRFNAIHVQMDDCMANGIRAKIKVDKLKVNFQSSTDASDVQVRLNINHELKANNPDLSEVDLDHIAYSGILVANNSVNVEAKITDSVATASKTLYVKMKASEAGAVASSIAKNHFEIEFQSDNNSASKLTTEHLIKAIEKYNPAFQEAYVKYVSFTGTLVEDQESKIIMNIKREGDVITKPLWIKMPSSGTEQIARKITVTRGLAVSYQLNADVTTTETRDALRRVLKNANQKLLDGDLESITFKDVDLAVGREVKIYMQIKKGEDPALLKMISVIMQPSAAQVISDKITNRHLRIKWQVDPSLYAGGTIAAIRSAIVESNHSISSQESDHVRFMGNGLIERQEVEIVAIIEVNKTTFKKKLFITMERSHARKILDKIDFFSFDISYNDVKSASSEFLMGVLRRGIQRVNPRLTDEDLKDLAFEGHFYHTDEPTAITMLINDHSQREVSRELKVRMKSSQASMILNKIVTPEFEIAYQNSHDASDAITTEHIRQTLLEKNDHLSRYDVEQIWFTGFLEAGQMARITAKVTIGQVSATLTLRIFMRVHA